MAEQAHFFRTGHGGGVDWLTARFRTHRYARHGHDTYVVGTILTGCGTLFLGGAQRYAGPGDLTLYNPQDAHDGAAHGDRGYSYRVGYPPPDLIEQVATELSGRAAVRPWFRAPVVGDPAGARLFIAAHRQLERGVDALAADELLYRALAHCLVRHARIEPAPIGREGRRMARIKARLTDLDGAPPSLAELAAEAGVSPHHLIRSFRAETGLTPHAYRIGRRVDAAMARLRRGEAVSAVAAATGFCDQAHLTRAFKARVGVTPGAFRATVTGSPA